jgi:hypothetical protein
MVSASIDQRGRVMPRHLVERSDDDLGTVPLVFVLALFGLLLLVHVLQT